MKVLHVLDHSLPVPSGYSVRSHSILTEQKKLGWDLRVVTGPKQEKWKDPVDHVDGIDYERLPPVSTRLHSLPVLDQAAVVKDLRAGLRRVIAREQPDIVHVHSPCLNGLAALGLGRPVVYELRSSWEDAAVSSGTTTEGSLRYRASRWLETQVLRRADAVTTICDGLRIEIVGRGIPEERVTVVPNAVDPRKLDEVVPDGTAARDQLGLKGRFVLGFLGSFFAWEGLEVLLRALPLIRRQRPDAAVMLVGAGPEMVRLRQLTASLGLEPHVCFAGQVPHSRILEMYSAVDLLVFPRVPIRLTEMVTPIKPLEAMALGKVVMASDVGGHRELVEHGRTGWLFDAGSPEALAKAVLELAPALDVQARLREQGRRYIAEQRTWARVVSRYAPVYAGLLQPAGARGAVRA